MIPFGSEIGNTRRRAICGLILACALVPAAAARRQSSDDAAAAKKPAAKSTTPTHKATSPKSTSATTKTHSASSGKRSSHKKSVRSRGQQKIESERARSIQEALIRERYMTGEPTGTWNQSSEDAMRRYQGDHGWQTKEVPDSRALIKLGLGPSNDHLLNPESAMTTVPDRPKAASMPTTSHSPAPGPEPVASPAQNNGPNPQ
jgi:peptidoglycan hydrolase-like protein with peptidoglycan-binding domain